ncbi:dicarboxylate/amino acid:cation symporter [Caldisalinibacter kiritimatiensis]|uniref:Proton/glutamate symport protein / Sodium/glutamate symport protein n=1 Tax=Caldisalinibacter kiritimatiensis TaxID=1304284 RepID=R1AS17_9FIRM|nr:dicarboxylate/amino acid:cation symporter [Caldisalinibacter kiritimatiensis]EOC99932.1 Proton/glutamate symport protein / Sodium/glutamate symport protein [Caldisalinibacter kiritimatiensis]
MLKNTKFLKNSANLILVAMVLGIIAGGVMGEDAAVFAPLGKVFMKLIKMLVIPLVTVSIISGAASLGNTKSAGKIGIATFGYYMGTTMFAVALGLLLGNIFKPGLGLDMSTIQSMFSDEYIDKGGTPGFWETILGIIPVNPFKALLDGNILQILFFSLFLGFGISTLEKEKKDTLLNMFNYIIEALIWMVEKVIIIAPIGVFGLMADAVGTFGYETLYLVLKLLGVYILALSIHTFGFYPFMVKMFSKLSPFKFLKKIRKAQMVALSTASSMGTLPVTLDVCEEDFEVSNSTASFVLPLGATINMDGNAIYYALVAMFFSQMFGIDLGITEYVAIILTATIGSIGQAGVPGPSLLVVAVLLSANIPVVGLPLLFGVDRIFDMLRTAVNITGDASCAVIVDQIFKVDEINNDMSENIA